MTVDLNTCVPGQLVELRNGNIVKYVNKYPHKTYPHKAGGCTYTDNGFYFASREEDEDDVVKIFPLTKAEQPKTDKHPSVAWWESCPWITDRKPTKEDGDAFGRVIVKTTYSKVIACTTFVQDVNNNEAWIHHYDWQPPTLTNKEQALELLNKHKDGVTMCVWIPTSEDWVTIRKGLEE
jgi:hypothetical protein